MEHGEQQRQVRPGQARLAGLLMHLDQCMRCYAMLCYDAMSSARHAVPVLSGRDTASIRLQLDMDTCFNLFSTTPTCSAAFSDICCVAVPCDRHVLIRYGKPLPVCMRGCVSPLSNPSFFFAVTCQHGLA